MLNYGYNVSTTQERELKKDYFSKKKIFCEEPDENKVSMNLKNMTFFDLFSIVFIFFVGFQR
jgi:hypothetical protein